MVEDWLWIQIYLAVKDKQVWNLWAKIWMGAYIKKC